jgi:hypothetical protein
MHVWNIHFEIVSFYYIALNCAFHINLFIAINRG